MIKLVFCLRRLPELSPVAFQRYWHDTHGPLVRSHAETLRIARYVQCHTSDDPANELLRVSRGGTEAYDGVAELWWASRADFEVALASPEGQAAGLALLEDERRFIDLERSALWIAEEKEIIPLRSHAA